MGPRFRANLTRHLTPLAGVRPRPGSPPPHVGAGRRREAGCSAKLEASASPPLRLAPSRPRGNSRDAHPGSPGLGALRAEARQVLPPTSSSGNFGTALGGWGAGARRPGPGGWEPGPRGPCPPTPLYSPRGTAHPRTPGRSGSFLSRAGGALSRWTGRVRAAPLSGVQAATHRPPPAADPPPGATGSSWSRRNRCRRRRHLLLLLPGRQQPRRGRPAGSRPPSLF